VLLKICLLIINTLLDIGKLTNKLVTKNRKNTKWSSLSSFWENMRVFGIMGEYYGEYVGNKALYGVA